MASELSGTVLLPVLAILCLGAISPGPSLAVLLRNTMEGGRLQGVLCGIGHGAGFGIYAFTTISGIAALKALSPMTATGLETAGALFLLWLAWQSFKMSDNTPTTEQHSSGPRRGFIQGFAIAFLNPKILVFLTAVFSRFVTPELSWTGRLVLACMAMMIDGGWYVLVALIIGSTSLLKGLQHHSLAINRIMGLLLLMLATMILIPIIVNELPWKSL